MPYELNADDGVGASLCIVTFQLNSEVDGHKEDFI
jgi:hypothetical protein